MLSSLIGFVEGCIYIMHYYPTRRPSTVRYSIDLSHTHTYTHPHTILRSALYYPRFIQHESPRNMTSQPMFWEVEVNGNRHLT